MGRGEHIYDSGYFLPYFFVSIALFLCKEDSELWTLISRVMKPETPPSLSSLSNAYMNLIRPVS